MKILTNQSMQHVTRLKIYEVHDSDKLTGYITDDTGNERYVNFSDWVIVDPIQPATIVSLINMIEEANAGMGSK